MDWSSRLVFIPGPQKWPVSKQQSYRSSCLTEESHLPLPIAFSEVYIAINPTGTHRKVWYPPIYLQCTKQRMVTLSVTCDTLHPLHKASRLLQECLRRRRTFNWTMTRAWQDLLTLVLGILGPFSYQADSGNRRSLSPEFSSLVSSLWIVVSILLLPLAIVDALAGK